MRRVSIVMAAALVAASCSGSAEPDDQPTTISEDGTAAASSRPSSTSSSTGTSAPVESTTTSEGTSTATSMDTTTTTAATTTTTKRTTTTQATTTTKATTTTTTTLPPSIALAAFAFASGTDPRINVAAFVGDSDTGPWQAAGFNDPVPELQGAKYWIRFVVTNVDSLGKVRSVDISGGPPDPGPIGSDVCDIGAAIGPAVSAECVIGGSTGFDVIPGGGQHGFTAVGDGFRQGTAAGVYFDPPIPENVGYGGGPHSFVLVFDTADGLRVDGIAYGEEIDINIGGLNLSFPVRIDCSDSFSGGASTTGNSPTSGEPKMIAHVIANFDGNGSQTGSCSHIPIRDLTFNVDGNSDFFIRYSTS